MTEPKPNGIDTASINSDGPYFAPTPTDSEKRFDFGYGSTGAGSEVGDTDGSGMTVTATATATTTSTDITSTPTTRITPSATASTPAKDLHTQIRSERSKLSHTEFERARSSLVASCAAITQAMDAMTRYKRSSTSASASPNNTSAHTMGKASPAAKAEFASAFSSAQSRWKEMSQSDVAIIAGWANGKVAVPVTADGDDEDQGLKSLARSWTSGRFFTDQWELEYEASEAGIRS
ncbi:hypothetical protein I316_01681 [Kwoniella heveanensis BCC8398]|uniref:Uncharacterized protein n=1 Tax=Kwoniella heveanensis BCC8398 TaxID=1296120 RepID=A0A1B9GZI8_9TREE|nr:hypothetical protein I316_01681 [Kwoniella heveanensis BCC8398]